MADPALEDSVNHNSRAWKREKTEAAYTAVDCGEEKWKTTKLLRETAKR